LLARTRPRPTTRFYIVTHPRHIRTVQNDHFQAFAPPDPSQLSKPPTPRATRSSRRRRRSGRFLLYTTVALGSGYLVDKYFYASSVARCARTFGTGLLVGLDYKINFRPDPPLADSIAALHARNARRLFDLLRENGGLYLKIGQAIAMQSAVMPREFQDMFSRMFDDAPQNGWDDVQKVIKEDFGGRSVEEVFGVSFADGGEVGKGVMERTASASASVAQVHWARLADGREVAIKIQKREIASQVGWDLWAFRVVANVYSWWFAIPFATLVPYITERLMLETDFENEANNAEEMARLVAGEPRLRNRVYIPKVYRELSSKRVMTAEWIEGVRLWDRDTITNSWYGSRGKGSPGAGGEPLPPAVSPSTGMQSNYPYEEHLKPKRDQWRGRSGNGGLGLTMEGVMRTIVDLFSAQMFLWGTVHCDPHPGNIFIRRKPGGQPEVVLIDHGLYVYMDPKFRHDYARFWKALMTFDNTTIREIVKGWGVNAPDFFASATLLQPYQGGDKSTANMIRKGFIDKELEDQPDDDEATRKDKAKKRKRLIADRHYAAQEAMRAQMREMLADETKWPRELIFIGRELRILQGLNQHLGTPVNRLKITGMWASRALAESSDQPFSSRVRNWYRHVIFRAVLLSTDLAFWVARFRQWVGWGGGLEDELEKGMRTAAKEMGIELNHDVFNG
jgi:aarF domain-containing kinase